MQDGIIKGTGNSRYLKSISNFLTQYPTYQDFAAALVAGTLPIDLNGINETGWDQIGTALNKANLLSDETAEALDLPSTAVPDDAFKTIHKRIESGSYVGTGTYGPSNPNVLTFPFAPKLVIVTGYWGGSASADGYTVILNPSTNNYSCWAGTAWFVGNILATGNSIQWNSSTAVGQGNVLDKTYNYVAIG